MATSTIMTGLRLVEIPNSCFTWNSNNKIFSCNKSNATTNTGLTNVVSYLVNGKGNIPVFSCSVFPDLSNYYLQVSGWFAKTATPITESDINYFSVYAIGY